MKAKTEYGSEIFELVDHNHGYRDVEIKKSYFEDNNDRYTFLIIKDITEYRRGLIRAAKIQRASMELDESFGEQFTFDCGYYPQDIVSGDTTILIIVKRAVS